MDLYKLRPNDPILQKLCVKEENEETIKKAVKILEEKYNCKLLDPSKRDLGRKYLGVFVAPVSNHVNASNVNDVNDDTHWAKLNLPEDFDLNNIMKEY